MSIPQANPKAEYDELAAEIDAAIQRVIQSNRYILGSEVQAFEQEFAAYIGVNYGIGVASGTDAIYLSLRALGVVSGDEVITVSHTAVATVSAIEQCGAIPVFADIAEDTFTLQPDELQKLVSSKTKVIIPVHLYGHPADLEPILKFARSQGLLVLEDCAQAHGAEYQGNKVGSWGDIAAFSFYPTKNLGAMGDGGMIVTDNAELADQVQLLRQYGWRQRYISETAGINSRLDELQAAILRVKLCHLDENNERRRRLANEYNGLLQSVIKPVEKVACRHVYHLYVIRHPQRDTLLTFLKNKGIGSLVHYPVPVHQQPAYEGRLRGQSVPITETICTQILSLPLFPQLSSEAVYMVSEAIGEFDYARKS